MVCEPSGGIVSAKSRALGPLLLPFVGLACCCRPRLRLLRFHFLLAVDLSAGGVTGGGGEGAAVAVVTVETATTLRPVIHPIAAQTVSRLARSEEGLVLYPISFTGAVPHDLNQFLQRERYTVKTPRILSRTLAQADTKMTATDMREGEERGRGTVECIRQASSGLNGGRRERSREQNWRTLCREHA